MTVEDDMLTDVSFARRLSRTTFSPAVSLFLLVGGLLTLVIFLLITMSWVSHTNEVIQRALYSEKLLLDLQTALRGYYLSGDVRLLEPYRGSQPKIPAALAALREQVKNDPAQLELATRIDHDAREWVSYVNQILERHNAAAGDLPTVDAFRFTNDEFDKLRARLDEFLGNQYWLRDRRASRTTRAVWISLILAGVATAVVGRYQRKQLHARQEAIREAYRGVLRIAKERRQRAQTVLQELDKELEAVGEIQRSLLPITLPSIPGLKIAASYQTSRRAGGDYYDFFPLPPEHAGDEDPIRYGILIADVSGHGTPAAVLMAVTHSIAHGFDQPTRLPCEMLAFVNRRLCEGYTTTTGAFVTAFYAIYDPEERRLIYSSAGHNPPRLRRAGAVDFEQLDDAQGLPLGVSFDEQYTCGDATLAPGDTLVLYTDGVTEARNDRDEFLGTERLDDALRIDASDPEKMLSSVLNTVDSFAGKAVTDDRTVLIVQVMPRADHHHTPKPTRVVETKQESMRV